MREGYFETKYWEKVEISSPTVALELLEDIANRAIEKGGIVRSIEEVQKINIALGVLSAFIDYSFSPPSSQQE